MGFVAEDLRSAIRTLRRWPALSITAVAILAIGIGANTAVYSLAEQVLNRPSPFREPERLVLLTEKRGQVYTTPASETWLAWRDHARTVEGTVAWGGAYGNLRTAADRVIEAKGCFARPGFFRFLGVEPFLGRGLASEDGESSAPAIVLSHRLWRELYGGDQGVLGQWLELDGEPYEVVGVLPRGFQLPLEPQARFWLSNAPRGQEHLVTAVLGRLAAGATHDDATRELSALAGEIVEGLEATVGPFEPLSLRVRPLVAVAWLSGAVLLIVCATIASLLLARGEVRAGELAMRSVLGAGWRPLVTQALAESLLLAGLGGGMGLLLALWISEPVLALIPPIHGDLDLEVGRLDRGHLLFTGLVSLAVGIVCGLVPAWHAASRDPGSIVVPATLTGTSKGSARWRQGLVVLTVAVSFTLLLGTVLVAHQVSSWAWIDRGFEPEGLWSLTVELPKTRYVDWQSRAELHDQILDQLTDRRLPRGESVALGGGLSRQMGSHAVTEIEPECQPTGSGEELVTMTAAAPRFFEVVGLNLRKGRGFHVTDRTAAIPPVVVNSALAERFWPDADPIGRRIGFGGLGCLEIVGVVDGWVKPGTHPDREAIFVPHWVPVPSSLAFLVRGESGPPETLALLRQRTEILEPEAKFTTLAVPHLIADPEWFETLRYFAMLGLFVLIAILLTTIGLYSIVTHGVRRRQSEIGVRITLGAQRWQILRTEILAGLRPVALGVVVGLLATAALSRIVDSWVYGSNLWQPVYVAIATFLLFTVCTVAAWIPARQATRVDPVVVLRRE